jgi:hypothetical protein
MSAMQPSTIRLTGRFIRAYYWSTPLFLGLSLVYGLDVRIPFLEAIPGARAVYYGLSFVCGGLVFFRPDWTAAVGYGESMLSTGLLVVTTWAAYFGMLESAASSDMLVVNPFTPETLTSLILSVMVFGASGVLQSASRISRPTDHALFPG